MTQQMATMIRTLASQKHLFDLAPDRHYLNCAYMGPLPRRVQEAGVAGVRRKADPAGITSEDFFTEADAVRRLFARLINAPDEQRIAIVPAASYGLAIVARNTPLRRGQNVVVADEQFPSNVYPWQRLVLEHGADLRTVVPPTSATGRGEGWNTRLLEAIDESTALVALPHVHWADGTRFDLTSIGARAREVGAALVVDGSQSVGALPFDVREMRPDALVVAAYKWLLGPYGIALAYLGSRYDGGVPLEENWINRQGSEDFASLVSYRDEYQPGALRYDVGERSNPILLPMLASALEQIHEWRPDRIQDYCGRLMCDVVGRAAELGFVVEEAAWRGTHLFGMRAPRDMDITRVQAALADRDVIVSLRGNAVRVSPNVYNDAADAAALLDALRASR